jgi:type VI secretion system protein ImpE
MNAQELFKAGRLAEAITAQTAEVKAQPTDAERRYLLFALLSFAGEWERAGRQLDALGVQDPQLAAGGRIYHNLLASEEERRAVHTGTARPLLPAEPPAHLTARLEALSARQAGDAAFVTRALGSAVAQQPALVGKINEQPFSALRDLDDFLGSVLEVFAGGRYLWLPLERVRTLTLAPPAHLLDLLWAPAQLEDSTGTTAAVHVPVLYVDSAAGADEELQLGRKTEWLDAGGGDFCRGQGQRMLAHALDEGEPEELAILDLRTLEIGDG